MDKITQRPSQQQQQQQQQQQHISFPSYDHPQKMISKIRPSTARSHSYQGEPETTNSRGSPIPVAISPQFKKSHITSFTPTPLTTTTITTKHYNVDQVDHLKQLQLQQQQQLQMQQLQEQCRRKVEHVQQQQLQYKKMLQQNRQQIEQLKQKELQQQRQNKLLELEQQQKQLREQYDEQKRQRDHLEEQLKQSGLRLTGVYTPEFFNQNTNVHKNVDAFVMEELRLSPSIEANNNNQTKLFSEIKEADIMVVPPPPYQHQIFKDTEDKDHIDDQSNNTNSDVTDSYKEENVQFIENNKTSVEDDESDRIKTADVENTSKKKTPKIKQTIATQTNNNDDNADDIALESQNKPQKDSNISDESEFSLQGEVCSITGERISTSENRQLSPKLPSPIARDETDWFESSLNTSTDVSTNLPQTSIRKPLIGANQTYGNVNKDEEEKLNEAPEADKLDLVKHESEDAEHLHETVENINSSANLKQTKIIEIRKIDTSHTSNINKSSSIKYAVDSKPPTPTRSDASTPKSQSQSNFFRLPTPELKIQYTSKDRTKTQNSKEIQEKQDSSLDVNTEKSPGKIFKGLSSPWNAKKNAVKKDPSTNLNSSEDKSRDHQKLSNSQKILNFLTVKSSPTLVKKFSKLIDLDKKVGNKRNRKKSADLLNESHKDKPAFVLPRTRSTSECEHSDSAPNNNLNEKSNTTCQLSDISPYNTFSKIPFKKDETPSAEILTLEVDERTGVPTRNLIYTPTSATCSRAGSPNGTTQYMRQHYRQNSEGSILSPGTFSPTTTTTTTAEPPSTQKPHFVIVAIDFGTTYSGYAFSFVRDPDSLHIMRRWEGGDPGLVNQKTLTTLLLNPEGKFHSFGFTARDSFHDLDQSECKRWYYFEKFKMTLHHNSELNKDTTINASNGQPFPALKVFAHSLKYFKDHALQELTDQSETSILNDDIRWVITVPAIWKAPAKQFMRQAAYMAGLASPDFPGQLLIALEPEAASIYVRKLRTYQLIPENSTNSMTLSASFSGMDSTTQKNDSYFSSEGRGNQSHDESVKYLTMPSSSFARCLTSPTSTTVTVGQEVDVDGTRYMVVDCGGGTVDITVHEMEENGGCLRELHRATGGPYGSIGIDYEFEKLLNNIFGSEFISSFKVKRPSGWVDLMTAFESRKRSAHPGKINPLNIALPFSFIEYCKKFKGVQVESAIKKYGSGDVTWSSQGMLRITTEVMRRLFVPTVEKIKQSIGDVLNNPNVRGIKYMFLVGGFAESGVLQQELRKEFGHILKIIIPQDVATTILKGAVCFGLDPTVVSVRRCRLTYGVGVLNRFIAGVHPDSKLVMKDGVQWCKDVLDKFVVVDQPVALGDTVVRSYAPAKVGQRTSVVHIYCTERPDAMLVTDPGVRRCGTLCLDVTEDLYRQHPSGIPCMRSRRAREIQATMTFGDTEIKVSAVDVHTGKCVKSVIDFLGR